MKDHLKFLALTSVSKLSIYKPTTNGCWIVVCNNLFATQRSTRNSSSSSTVVLCHCFLWKFGMQINQTCRRSWLEAHSFTPQGQLLKALSTSPDLPHNCWNAIMSFNHKQLSKRVSASTSVQKARSRSL